MAIYKTLEDKESSPISGERGGYIPFGHWQYVEVMREVAEGVSTIEPYVEPSEPNATTCTKLRMLEELASLGKEEALFAALGSSEAMMRRWNAASELNASHPMVATMAAVLGYSAEQMQVIFNDAAKRA